MLTPVERARFRLGSCADVLSRHGVAVVNGMCRCPFHDDRTPSFSLFTSNTDGRSRAKCHGTCGWGGDALDLEASLSGASLREVIKRCCDDLDTILTVSRHVVDDGGGS